MSRYSSNMLMLLVLITSGGSIYFMTKGSPLLGIQTLLTGIFLVLAQILVAIKEK